MRKKGLYARPRENGAKGVWWIIACFGLLLLVILAFGVSQINEYTWDADIPNPTVKKNPDSIAIPGYEILTLEADSTKQTICLPNPPQNCCYFKITLSLEDGTVLWQSNLIPPGEKSTTITLNRPLSKGTYTGAKLMYQCFQMNEDFTPLNGAETKLTLLVK